MQDPYDSSQIYIDYSPPREYTGTEAQHPATWQDPQRSYPTPTYSDHHHFRKPPRGHTSRPDPNTRYSVEDHLQSEQQGFPARYSCDMGSCPDSAWPQKFKMVIPNTGGNVGGSSGSGNAGGGKGSGSGKGSGNGGSGKEGFGSVDMSTEKILLFIVFIMFAILLVCVHNARILLDIKLALAQGKKTEPNTE